MAANGGETERIYRKKYAEFERLFREIQDLEMGNPKWKRERLAAMDSKMYEGDDALSRCQAQLRATLDELETLRIENRKLEDQVKAKEVALNRALDDLQDAHRENNNLIAEYRSLEATAVKNKGESSMGATSGRRAGANMARTGPGAPDEDYFRLLDKLENEIKVKDDEIKQYWQDRTFLDQQMKKKDQQIDELRSQMQKQSRSVEEVAELDSKVRELSRKIESVQHDNSNLNNLCREKTKIIEKLQVDLEARAQSEEYVRQLETAVRNKEKIIEESQEAIDRLNYAHSKTLVELDKLAEEAKNAGGIKFKDWYEERRALKSEVDRLSDVKDGKDKIIKSQHQRINQLAGRMETLSRSLHDAAHLSARHASMLATPSRPGGGVFVDEDGQELIAAELYDALARDVHIMKIKLTEKDNLMVEKDDIIECWERKNDILNKTSGLEMNNLRQSKEELTKKVAALKLQLSQKDKDLKNRVQQMKMENLKLQKKLERFLNRSGGAPRTPNRSIEDGGAATPPLY